MGQVLLLSGPNHKKYIVLLLLFSAVFSLSAQETQNVVIYVPEITGYGRSPSDNYFIAKMLNDEVEARGYIPVSSSSGADYHLIGTLSSHGDDEKEPGSGYGVFHLLLKSAKTGKILAEQEIVYTSIDEMDDAFTMLMFNMFSENLGKEMVDISSWRNDWFYAGVSFFWTPRMYYGRELSSSLINFGGGASLEFYFHKLLSFETGMEFATDWVVVSTIPGDYYQDLLLEIPLLIKFAVKPADKYLLWPYTGVHINVPLFRETIPPPFSLTAGCQLGLKAGMGLLYADPRFTIDLGKSGIRSFYDPYTCPYQRIILHFGFGYKYGIFSKEQTLREHFDRLFPGTKHRQKDIMGDQENTYEN